MKELATVLALVLVCLASYARVGLRDRTSNKGQRQEKYTRIARKLAREYRDDNRDAAVKTESAIALPSVAFFDASGVIVAIVAEFAMSDRRSGILYWLNNRIVDPFGAEFAYIEPVLTVVVVLAIFRITVALTSYVAEAHARIIADRRIQKGRSVCFAQRRSILEPVEGLAARVAALVARLAARVTALVAQLVDRRKGEDAADSEEEPVATRAR